MKRKKLLCELGQYFQINYYFLKTDIINRFGKCIQMSKILVFQQKFFTIYLDFKQKILLQHDCGLGDKTFFPLSQRRFVFVL